MFTTLDKTSKICYSFVDPQRYILMTKKLCLRSFSLLASAVAAFGLASGDPASAQDKEEVIPHIYSNSKVEEKDVTICQRSKCIKLHPDNPLYHRVWIEIQIELRRQSGEVDPPQVRFKRPSPRPLAEDEGAPIGYPGVR